MVHPGYPSDPGTGGLPVPDEFSLSTDRQFELDMLKNLAPQFEIIIPSWFVSVFIIATEINAYLYPV